MNEAEEVTARYARRAQHVSADRYSVLNAEVWLWRQERQRALLRHLKKRAPAPLAELRVLEIGCGAGTNLLELIELGFDPARLVGNELLAERAQRARRNLPEACAVVAGDALTVALPSMEFDLVCQNTVFTSLLDAQFRRELAARMWSLVKPGGAVVWYDFVYDNPRNPDVRGVPLAEVRALFPDARIHAERVTLAPPIARRVSALHPFLYHAFNLVPWLRSHVLCWIGKTHTK